ncbi:MAG TPA: excinuclease ABC subunit UvrA [Clostridiales bacterium]|nr:excinuclease ABC subunit UvrA [Clostridiales bacterium]
MLEDIVIKGARENNLKNINLTIPRNKLVVFTGVSGSGKSTLAFDTIFAEGQRRYMESLSSYARQFLGQMSKPDVDSIDGLSPSISIDQKTTSNNPRSTVGTVTEIYDYLRLLFAHIGKAYCPNCKKEISTQSIDVIIDKIMELKDKKIQIMASYVKGKKGTFAKELDDLRKEGYHRVKIDGSDMTLDDDIKLEKNIRHTIYVVIDRLVVRDENQSRITDSVESAIKLSKGTVNIDVEGEMMLFSTTHFCDECGYSIEEIAPRLFSFNSPFGACEDCKGLGFKQIIDVEKIITNPNMPINKCGLSNVSGWSYDSGMAKMFYRAVARKFGVSLDTPVKDLPAGMLDMILYGTKKEKLDIDYVRLGEQVVGQMAFEGIIPNIERRFRETTSDYAKEEIRKLMKEEICPTCHGDRLKIEALNIFINRKNIIDVCNMSVKNILSFMENLKLSKMNETIAEPILKEIKSRLHFLVDVGLDYLTLSRMAGTLSGGESQRIRLATQIGSGLTGVIYILDEPSIGLHQRDNDKLLDTLKHLRDLGNTVIVVEHDEDTMKIADYIVDIGKYAGVHGGNVVVAGTLQDVINCKDSITGEFLSGKRKINVPKARREISRGYIEIKGCTHNNLKNVNLKIPMGVTTVVTGVSGSGKSSLINETLYPVVYNYVNKSDMIEGKHKSVSGLENVDKVINIDQSPIGKTPRSNPATYTNVFTDIRNLFAETSSAKERGYTAGRFSFNISGGRCESCGGAGIKKIEMFFLPDVYVTCDVCHGKRYNRETLEVKFKGKSIYDVLDMTISEANEFFENVPRIKNKIQTLVDVGLGYVKLGQPATELSGGEAQRVKLACELSKRSTGKSLYILDEPTTGLHLYDIEKLMHIIDRLVDNGNTCVIIEHNLDVIKCADYIIDVGMEGGDLGGEIISTGTPEEIVKKNIGYTAKYLKDYLKK